MQRLLLSLLALLVATGTAAIASDLQLTDIHPPWGVESLSTEIDVMGANFMAGTELALVGGGAYFVSSTESGAAFDVAVIESLAYAVGGRELEVYDVADPWSPRLVSTLPDVSGGWAIVIEDDYAYIIGNGDLHVVDLADPLEPRLVGTADSCSGLWQDVDVEWPIAVVACSSEEGIRTFDVSDPLHPRALGSLESPGGRDSRVHAVIVRDDVAFLADKRMGLVAVDISEPSTPSVLWTPEPRTSWGRDLEVAGDYAYVTGEHLGVQVFDIRDPADIALVGQAGPSRNAYAIALSEGFAFVGDSAAAGLHVYDIRDPHQPLSSYLVRPQNPISFGFNIAVDDGFAYVANFWTGSLDIYDVRVTPLPGITGQLQTRGRAYDVVVRESLAYVAADYGGLQILDITEPSQPLLLGSTEDVDAYHVVIRGELAYVTDWTFGLHIIDVSVPDTPRVMGRCRTPSYAHALAVEEPYVYINHYTLDEVIVVDATDTANPTLVATVPMDDRISELVVANGLLYVANSGEGLVIMELSNPALPNRVSALPTSGRLTGVAVSGDLASLADGPGGFHSVDISDPVSPRIIGTLQNGIEPTGVTLSGTTAFVRGQVGGYEDFLGMLMIDVSDPTAPRLVGGSDHVIGETDVSGDFVYMASYSGGLQVFRVPPIQETCVVAPDQASVQMPSGMNVGTYHVLGLDPNGQFDILRNAFTILPDGDGDGVPTDEDCDDSDPSIYPGAPDYPGNEIDEDCDGSLACDPVAEWRNRGEFVSCIARECALLRKAGLVTGQECGELVRDAARSAVQ